MGSWFGGGKKEEPVMQAPPPPVQSSSNQDPEALKRIGRSALIASSSRGVLGNATTSRKQLTA